MHRYDGGFGKFPPCRVGGSSDELLVDFLVGLRWGGIRGIDGVEVLFDRGKGISIWLAGWLDGVS